MAELESLRREHAQATRRAVLDAARRRFGTAGYAQTSIDEIAADARVTKGAVYHHFASKTALFRAVLDEVELETETRIGRAGTGAASAVEAILSGIDAYLDAALAPELQRITLLDAPAVLGPDPYDPATAAAGHAALSALIAGAVADGTLTEVDPAALAHLIRGSALTAATLIAHAPDPVAARQALGSTLRTLIEGLRR